MTPPVRIEALRHRPGPGFTLELHDITLGPGLTLIQGPNGAGKTTLLRILATLTQPTRGQLSLLGLDPATDGARLRARLGFSGHTPSLHGALTITENLTLHARLHDLPDQSVAPALDQWELSDVAEQPVQALSHGQARRADLARATLHAPELLLLDEPTSGLDEAASQALAGQLETLAPEATLVASHGQPPLEPEAILRLKDGHRVHEVSP